METLKISVFLTSFHFIDTETQSRSRASCWPMFPSVCVCADENLHASPPPVDCILEVTESLCLQMCVAAVGGSQSRGCTGCTSCPSCSLPYSP